MPEVSNRLKSIGYAVAEREGFEPSRRFPAYTLSRRAPSTTRPPLLAALFSLFWHHLARNKPTRSAAGVHRMAPSRFSGPSAVRNPSGPTHGPTGQGKSQSPVCERFSKAFPIRNRRVRALCRRRRRGPLPTASHRAKGMRVEPSTRAKPSAFKVAITLVIRQAPSRGAAPCRTAISPSGSSELSRRVGSVAGRLANCAASQIISRSTRITRGPRRLSAFASCTTRW